MKKSQRRVRRLALCLSSIGVSLFSPAGSYEQWAGEPEGQLRKRTPEQRNLAETSAQRPPIVRSSGGSLLEPSLTILVGRGNCWDSRSGSLLCQQSLQGGEHFLRLLWLPHVPVGDGKVRVRGVLARVDRTGGFELHGSFPVALLALIDRAQRDVRQAESRILLNRFFQGCLGFRVRRLSRSCARGEQAFSK